MKQRSTNSLILGGLLSLISTQTWSQQEAVEGYYDENKHWFVFEWNNPEKGRQQAILDSSSKVKPEIHANVSTDETSGTYVYSFEVSNLPRAILLLDNISVRHLAPVFEAKSPEPQREWSSGEYEGKSAWNWTKTSGAQSGIPAGKSAKGFSFKSKGIPTIVDTWFAGERRVKYRGPSPESDTVEVNMSFERVFEKLETQYPDKIASVVKLRTLGPVIPPEKFTPNEAIEYMSNLVKQSLDLGWIKNAGIAKSLEAKLATSGKKLGTGDVQTAKNVLNAFVNEIEAQKGKQLTSEGFALLYFSGKYLIDHMH